MEAVAAAVGRRYPHKRPKGLPALCMRQAARLLGGRQCRRNRGTPPLPPASLPHSSRGSMDAQRRAEVVEAAAGTAAARGPSHAVAAHAMRIRGGVVRMVLDVTYMWGTSPNSPPLTPPSQSPPPSPQTPRAPGAAFSLPFEASALATPPPCPPQPPVHEWRQQQREVTALVQTDVLSHFTTVGAAGRLVGAPPLPTIPAVLVAATAARPGRRDAQARTPPPAFPRRLVQRLQHPRRRHVGYSGEGGCANGAPPLPSTARLRPTRLR